MKLFKFTMLTSSLFLVACSYIQSRQTMIDEPIVEPVTKHVKVVKYTNVVKPKPIANVIKPTKIDNVKVLEKRKEIKKKQIVDNVVKATNRPGVKHGVWWLTGQHANEFFVTTGKTVSSKAEPKIYGDLWFVSEFQKAVNALKKAGVVGISHYGLYEYRNIARSHKLSRHSNGLALDVTGFYLDSKKYINVKNGWKHVQHRERLVILRNVLCDYFHVVLTPFYNKAHHDHFHIDLDPKKKPYEINDIWNNLRTNDAGFDDHDEIVGSTFDRHPYTESDIEVCH